MESNSNEEIKIYYVENQIGDDNKAILQNLVNRYGADIFFISADNIDTSFIKKTWFSEAGYYRLLVSKLIPEDKIIYLDCDTLVLGSFSELWKMDLDNFLIGGVVDTVQNYIATTIGMKSNSCYLNSGMLYMNLKRWREEDVDNQVRMMFEKYNGNVPHHDQGVINCIANGKILYLSPRYNLMSQYLYFNRNQLVSLYGFSEFYSEKEIEFAKKYPIVIHFLNKFYGRPWLLGSAHPHAKEFDKCAKRNGITISKGNKDNNKGIALRKYIYEHFPFIMYRWLEKILDVKRRIIFFKNYRV